MPSNKNSIPDIWCVWKWATPEPPSWGNFGHNESQWGSKPWYPVFRHNHLWIICGIPYIYLHICWLYLLFPIHRYSHYIDIPIVFQTLLVIYPMIFPLDLPRSFPSDLPMLSHAIGGDWEPWLIFLVNLWLIMVNNWNNNISGWWFGTWMDHDFPYIGISSSQLTFTPSFFRGLGWNHQPDSDGYINSD